jgi:hypothetical protein
VSAKSARTSDVSVKKPIFRTLLPFSRSNLVRAIDRTNR